MARRLSLDYCPLLGRSTSVRDRLLAVALAQLDEVGATRVSLRAIAKRVGVSHQAASHYFAGRSALFEQLAVDGLAVLERGYSATREQVHARPEDAVVAMAEMYLDFAGEQPALFDLAFGTGSGLIERSAQEVAAARARVWEQLLGAVRDAVADGWGAGLPAETLALLCWSTVHGLASLRRDGTVTVHGGDVSALMRQSVAAVGRRSDT